MVTLRLIETFLAFVLPMEISRLKGINIIGLKRAGYSKQDITEVVDFYRTMEASALSPNFVNHDELMQSLRDKIIDEMRVFIKDSEIGIAPFGTNF